MDLNSIDDIKTYLENNNITLEDLADELGVNSDFLKNIFDKKYLFMDSTDINYVQEAILRIINSK
nr:MAG TPA: helix-turn-helix domain protein [Caudoviricetes sp.]